MTKAAASSDFFQQLPPDGEWVLIADDAIEKTLHLDAQPDGDQEFKVTGGNARGPGLPSAVASLHFGT